MVPEGRVYEGFRAEFVAAAADLSVTAAVSQLPKSTYSSGPSESAPEAIRICNTLLALDPIDAFGTGNALLARALAASHRYDEAIIAASTATKKEKWQNDAWFSYRFARLLSLTNQLDQVGDWIKVAYELGINNIAMVREDADLANYRKGRAEQYKQLTTVKFNWDIKYGWFFDDLILKNDSLFELTNILVYVSKLDNSDVDVRFKLASLKPGEEHIFRNSLSFSKSSSFLVTVALDSDQAMH